MSSGVGGVLNHNPRMSSRWIGFFVWALVAACIAFWGLKIFAATHPVPAGALTPVPPVATAGPMVRLFGAAPTPDDGDDSAPSPASDRYQLVGVIAPQAGKQGIAIVSLDNQPAKAWHVGATVEGDTTLLGVARRSAEFGPTGGPASFTLELPAPAAAQTGTLPNPLAQATTPVAPVDTGRGIGGQAGALMRAREGGGGFLNNRAGIHMPPGGRPNPGGGYQPQPGGNGAGLSQPPPSPPQPQQSQDDDSNSDE